MSIYFLNQSLLLRVCFAILVLTCSSPLRSQEVDLRFPALNVWDQVRELVRDKRLQLALEVSPDQLIAVKSVLSEEWTATFNKKNRDDRLQRRPRLTREQTLALFDEPLREELLKALDPAQVSALDLSIRRKKFLNPVAPFAAGNLVELCKFSGNKRVEYLRNLDEALAIHTEKSEELRVQACKLMMNSLPFAARERFVQYIGNAFTPDIKLDLSLTVEELPYPAGQFIDYALVLDQEELQRQLKISSEQRAELNRLQQHYQNELDDIIENDVLGDEKLGQIAAKRNKVTEESNKLLSAAQRLALARRLAEGRFSSDFVKTLSQPELLDYLELSAQERTSVLKEADEQKKKLEQDLVKLNEQTFDKLLNEIPEHLREPMSTRFAETWSAQ